ncbi:MAG: SDR family oxidoreductase [Myxococcota bacterium]
MSTNENMTILVTGATGTVGSEVVGALRARGLRVRAGVRSPEKAEALRALGAELVKLDFSDPSTLGSAFEGVDRVFLLTAFVEDDVEQVQAAVSAAKAAGVEHVVRSSSVGASPDSPLALSRKHAACEEVVKTSGIDWTILQPTFFQDNILNFAGETIASQGQWVGASAGGKTSYISSRDIAELAAEVLLDPGSHRDQTYVLTGPSAHSDAEIAGLLSELLGREIRYIDIGAEALAEGLRSGGFPQWRIDALVGLEGVKAAGYAEEVSPVVERILGRSGESLSAFLARNRDRLQA